jgi:hypothetical protein
MVMNVSKVFADHLESSTCQNAEGGQLATSDSEEIVLKPDGMLTRFFGGVSFATVDNWPQSRTGRYYIVKTQFLSWENKSKCFQEVFCFGPTDALCRSSISLPGVTVLCMINSCRFTCHTLEPLKRQEIEDLIF